MLAKDLARSRRVATHILFGCVVGKGEMLGVIPVSKGHFVCIRIIPSMRFDNDFVSIEVSALVSAKKSYVLKL